MQVRIGKSKYFLLSDPYNITLAQEKTREGGKNKGQVYMEDMGYYRDIPQALKALADKMLMKSDAEDMETLLKEVRAVYDLIDAHIKKVGFNQPKKETRKAVAK